MKSLSQKTILTVTLLALSPAVFAGAPLEADLLASYSASYAASLGGQDNAQVLIANTVAGSNKIQDQSGTGVHMRVAGYYQSIRDVTGQTTTGGIITWLANNDFHLSDVVSNGATVGADLVVYICNNSDSSSINGVSEQPGYYSSLNPGAVFAPVFAHETGGHCFGRAHADGKVNPKTIMLNNYCGGGAAPPYFYTNPKIWFNGVQLLGDGATACPSAGASQVNGGDNTAPTETSAQAVADRRARVIVGPDLSDAVLHWSFTNAPGSAPASTTNYDLISGAPAVVRGTGAIYTGSALRIPGGTTGNVVMNSMSAYIDLPNGIISSQTNITIEIWATPQSAPNNARIMDFGRCTEAGDGLGAPGEYTGASSDPAPGTTSSYDSITLSAAIGTDITQQLFQGKLAGYATTLDANLATVAGVQHHYAITFTDGAGAAGSAGGRWQWFRDGDAVAYLDVTNHLADLHDVNNWLGRSQWSADSLANNDYAEVRISSVAMSRGQILANYLLGPNYIPIANATLTGSDASGSTSFNAAGNWSSGAAPSSVNTYETYEFLLRTPATSSSYMFAGNALTLSGGSLLWKGTSSSTITINNLTLNSGTVQNAGSGTFMLAGNVTITNGAVFNAVNGPITLAANLNGVGPITFLAPGTTTTLSGNNSAFTGQISIGNGSANTSQVGTTVVIDSQARLGANPATFIPNQVDMNRGTLQTTTTMTLSNNNCGILLDISGGTFDVASSTALTLASPLSSPAAPSGYNVIAGALTKADAGTLILSSPSNTFIGTLYVDTGSTSANDGIVKVVNNQVLANAHSPIYIDNNTGGSSTLQLDGTGGNITLSQWIAINGRNGTVPAIENLAGNNSINGMAIYAGGSNYLVQSDAGLLTFYGGAVQSGATGNRTLAFQGSGNSAITSTVQNGSATPLNFVKAGTGTLTLSGSDTYTGTTTVSGGTLLVNNLLGTNTVTVASGGTLGGVGNIAGNVSVQSGGTLAPGTNSSSTGMLTVGNNVNLAGTTLMKINKGAVTNDLLAVRGTLTYGSTLTVTNLGGTLALGDSFDLFNSAGVAGFFTSSNLPPLSAGLVWNFNPVSGVLTVASSANTPPTISVVSNQTVNENNSTAALPLTVGDAQTPAASLTLGAASSNPSLVPAGNIVFGGSGSSRTVTILSATNQFGSATITLDVSDGSLNTSETFLLTVNFVDQPPTISAIPNQIGNKNSVIGPLNFTIGDPDTAVGSLTLSATSSNTNLVPTNNIVFGGSGANPTVTLTPLANQVGSSTITLTVSDGTFSANSTFVLTIQAVPAISKANNNTNLNLVGSWVGGVVPDAGTIAVWDSTVTSANAVLLGTNLSFSGLMITNPAGAVTINSGNALTIGASGIDMSLASQNLTINSGLTIGAVNQAWNVASSQTLAVAGTFTRTFPGATLNVGGRSGTVAFNPTLTNGIVGPWAVVNNSGVAANNSANGFTYATVSGGNIVPYILASNVTAFGWSSGNGGATNYDVSGVQGNLGVARTANTVRYTGAAGTQNWGNLNTTAITLNGLMNAGTGTLTFSQAGGSSLGQLVAGANNEMVLNAANAGITIAIPILDGSASSALTIASAGTNIVNLSGTNTYSGNTTVNGNLQLGAANMIPSGSGKGDVAVNGMLDLNAFSETINGLSGNGTIGTIIGGTPTLTIGNNNVSSTFSGLIKNSAGTLALTKTGSGTLTLSGLNNTYSGSTTIGTGGGASVIRAAATQALGFGGTIVFDPTGNGSTARLEFSNNVSLPNAITFSGRNNSSVGIENINGSNTLAGTITLASGGSIYLIQSDTNQLTLGLTGSTAITSTGSKIVTLQGVSSGVVAGNIVAGAGVGVIKTGNGTWTLGGNNTYTNTTTISGGTLLVNGSIVGTGAVTVGNNSTLGGAGTIGGATTMNAGTWLIPGTNGNGTLTFGSNLTLNATATNSFVITNGSGIGNPVVVVGQLVPSNSVIQLTYDTDVTVGTNTLFTYGTISGAFNATPVFVAAPGADAAPPTTAAIVDDGQGHINLVVGSTTAPSTNACLTSLALSPLGTLIPAFATNVFTYAATNAYTNNPVTVTATSADPNATLQINLNGGAFNFLASGVASGSQILKLVPPTNTLTVWTIAPDGVTSNLYTVNVILQPNLATFQMTNKITSGTNLTLSWPADHTGWRLLCQTNPLAKGLGTNWFDVPDSTSTNQVTQPISPSNPSVFFWLIYP